MKKIIPKIILASSSKKRAEILAMSGIKFEVIVSNIEEISDPNIPVKKIVKENSKIKALAVFNSFKKENCLVIGADTVVSINNYVLGKPNINENADDVFKQYCNNNAYVYTGLTLIYKNKIKQGVERSIVKINQDVYFKNKELINKIFSYDKAGGFSIEGLGAVVFDNVNGSYFNILGFPMKLFYNLLNDIGFNILEICS